MHKVLVAIILFSAALAAAQNQLSVKWEELTAGDFREAIQRSQGTCVLPFGIIEKHGPHLPLGTDLLDVRNASLHAAEQEYAPVFPPYYFGQIFEAKHQPGTIAYSSDIQMKLLQETVDEMARNGCKKVIVVNGHGGNNSFLPFFAQSQLDRPRDFVVYIFGLPNLEGMAARKSQIDMHAGETETSQMLVAAPNVVHMDRATQESGADQARQKLPPSLYTGIWWYARFPNHYSGSGADADKQLGEQRVDGWIKQVAEAIRAVKADTATLQLQNRFFEEAKHPLETKPVPAPK